MPNIRQGGNYTEPVVIRRSSREYLTFFIAYSGYDEIGRFPSHQEAELAIREPFGAVDFIHIDARTDNE